MAIFIYREQSGESGTVHFPWLHLMHGICYPQLELLRSSTTSEDVFIFYFVLTMICGIGLTVGGALDMQLLLLLFGSLFNQTIFSIDYSR